MQKAESSVIWGWTACFLLAAREFVKNTGNLTCRRAAVKGKIISTHFEQLVIEVFTKLKAEEERLRSK